MADDVITQEPVVSAPAAAETPAPADVAAPSPTRAPVPLLDLLGDVRVTATVELGAAKVRLGDLGTIRPGAVVELDRAVGERADLLANGHLIAHGEATGHVAFDAYLHDWPRPLKRVHLAQTQPPVLCVFEQARHHLAAPPGVFRH